MTYREWQDMKWRTADHQPVIDTKKEETEHEMVDSVSPLMDVDTEEGEISC